MGIDLNRLISVKKPATPKETIKMRSMLHSAALIDAWFDTFIPLQRQLAQDMKRAVMSAEPSLTLSIKWGNLIFSHMGIHIGAIVMYKEHAHLQVFNGAQVASQFSALEGTGRGLRHIKFKCKQAVNADLIKSVIRASLDELACASST
jgi:hypothetical protein